VDDQLKHFLGPHGGFAKDGADIQDAQAAHFQKIAQQRRAAAFQRFRPNAIQLYGIIGYQAVAARDQLQCQLAFTHGRVAHDQHADFQYIQKHAMHHR